ncbi:MAG: hypothetical protein RI909_863 [Bacteroidota bacterium]|jgi:hypothetical protein
MIYPDSFYSYRYDPEFVKEMTTLLISNLTDLSKSLNEAIIKNEPNLFIQQLTFSQFALVLVSNEDLSLTTYQIKKGMTENSSIEESFHLVAPFKKLCSYEINRLNQKLSHFEKFSRFKVLPKRVS